MLARKGVILLVTLYSLAYYSCKQQANSASMQPVDGYPFTLDMNEIKDILKHRGLDTIAFHQGEIIADIGAGNGYLEAMLSIFHDSLTFYIQDIDTSVNNEHALREVLEFYQDVRGRPFNNEFVVVNGSDTKTNLPDNTFDKILMLWTYSYLKEPKVFIKDVRNKLKPGGLFYVINPPIEKSEYTESLKLNYGWNVSPLEKQVSDIIDCGFSLLRISKNYDVDGYNEPYTMVFGKKTD